MQLQGLVGPPSVSSIQPATPETFRLGQLADLIVSELHGKFYETNYRGGLFGCYYAPTVSAATNAVATLGATCAPIIGVWNPATSSVNLEIVKAYCSIQAPASAGITGSLVWAWSVGNGAITTGSTPISRQMGGPASQAKFYNMAVALTGLTNNLVVSAISSIGGLTGAQPATVVPLLQSNCYEEIDGTIIVPPGGVLALLNTTSNTTAYFAGGLVWAEVPK